MNNNFTKWILQILKLWKDKCQKKRLFLFIYAIQFIKYRKLFNCWCNFSVYPQWLQKCKKKYKNPFKKWSLIINQNTLIDRIDRVWSLRYKKLNSWIDSGLPNTFVMYLQVCVLFPRMLMYTLHYTLIKIKHTVSVLKTGAPRHVQAKLWTFLILWSVQKM